MKIEDMNVTVKKEDTKYGSINRFYQDGVVLEREYWPKRKAVVFLACSGKLRLVEVICSESGQNRFQYQFLDDKSVEIGYGYFYKVHDVC